VRANLFAALIGVLCVSGCGGGSGSLAGGGGGGGGTPTGSNVQAIVVDSGPTPVATSSTPAVNTAYTTVTICAPGSTSNCQTIDHIQVDTGSSGLRIISPGVLTITLPTQPDANIANNVVAECVGFVDGSSWGSVRQADVKIGGETALKQLIQVIGDPAYAVPSTCKGTTANPTLENSVANFGANGILGVAPFISDCGPACLQQNNGTYYTCPPSGACAQTTMPENLQVSNPIAAFTTDNNGVIIQLPSVAASGTSSVSGSMIFGVGTQSNNGLGSATVFNLDGNGFMATKYGLATLHTAFIDSGSNAYYFPDNNLKNTAACATNQGFWCPSADLGLSATIVNPVNNASKGVSFLVTNADNLFKNAKSIIAATSGLAGDSTLFGDGTGGTINGSDAFDWGLPFYYGKTVFVVIEGKNTAGGTGPFFAF